MMWGLNPGPLLFETNPEFCWSLISSLYIANVFTLAVAVLVIPFLIKILSVPIKYMIPIITCVCIVGAYSTSYSMYGVIVMFISGIVGYILDKNGFPPAPWPSCWLPCWRRTCARPSLPLRAAWWCSPIPP